MKKLLYIVLFLATAIGFTSCEEKERELPTDEKVSYIGSLGVLYMTRPIYTAEDIEINTESDAKSITLSMSGIKFIEAMPALDIVLPSIPKISEGVYVAESVAPTTPDGEPYSDDTIKKIYNVNVAEADGQIEMTFDCDVATNGMGELTCTVTYSGKEE